MSAHVFSEIFLHFNWRTDGDLPTLVPTVEKLAHNFIRNKCQNSMGVVFEEIGGTETHVHLVLRIDPLVSISKFISEVKGSSSYETNKDLGKKVLSWQKGFGVVSVGREQLEAVREYVRNQKEHHRKGTVIEKFERNDMPPEGESEQPEIPAE